MGKAPKSTKKFQKNHLKRTLDQRKVEQKYKQKTQQSKRKRASKSSDNAPADKKKDTGEVFEDMSVEDFLNGGFEVPEDAEGAPKGSKSSKSSKGAAGATGAKSKADEAAEHKAQLEALAQKDPEFYKYLKENDKDLLDFDFDGGDDSDEDEDEEGEDDVEGDDADGDEPMMEKAHDDAPVDQIDLSMKDVNAWKKSLSSENSLRTLKKVLQAFTAAVSASEDEEKSAEYKYTVTNPDVFNRLLLLALSQVPKTVRHHIPLSKDKTVPDDNKKIKALSSSLKAYGNALVVLLSGNHDSEIVTLILKSIGEMVPYLLSHRRVIKDLISSVVNVLCQSSSDDQSRLAAFSFLEETGQTYKKSLLEHILKSTYGGFVKYSRRTTVHTMPAINLQKNLVATLFEIDLNMSYQLGFQFIRQLAIHLRSSIVNKTAESYKTVYNWQYIHSLDFWSRAISTQCDVRKETASKQSPLRSLILPLVQVTLGAMRLIPSPQYFPLRFYLIRSLIRLARHSGVFIPLMPVLMEILSSTTITKPAKGTTLQSLDFDHVIRASKHYLGTRVYQDGVCEQFIELSGEFFALYCKSIAFPELCIPVVVSLKRFVKRSKNVKFNKQIQKLVEKLDQNAKYIEQHRNSVTFGPLNRAEVDAFLKNEPWEKTPLGAYVVVQREIKEEKLRILRESMELEKQSEEEKDDDDELMAIDVSDDDEDAEGVEDIDDDEDEDEE